MKIICIGRNYVDHAKEMNSDVPSEPMFFMKPDTALLKEGDFYYPDFSNNIHHEIELVVKIKKAGKHIAPEFAAGYYDEIGLGIDFTARDIQSSCKEKGHPWEKAKAFDSSAVLSNRFIHKDKIDLSKLNFSLEINGTTIQSGNSKDMIFSIDQLICYVSQFITLKTGDLIYTGTPAGVGPVKIGDQLNGKIEGEEFFSLNIR